MDCIFNKCELYNGLLIGIVASLITSIIIHLGNKMKLKRKYGKLEGHYSGHGYSHENNDLKLEQRIQSRATINYLKNNLLQFELTENSTEPRYKWNGIIVMEFENYGSIAWKYDLYNGERLGQEKHKFGFKRLIVNETNNSLFIYLIEENLVQGEKYPREVLIKDK